MSMHVKICLAEREGDMNYLVAHPNHFRDLPLLVYLHGAGERGRCAEHLYRHGIPRLLREGREYPAVVLCPQCPGPFIWNNMVKELKELIDRVAAEYGILRDRIVLTGSSMGGYGTWEMAMCYPEAFAAIAPVAGGGVVWRVSKLVGLPVLAYHGDADEVVPPLQSEVMVSSLLRSGGTAELTLLEGKGHNDGIYAAYADTDLVRRLLSYRKTEFGHVPEPCEHLF